LSCAAFFWGQTNVVKRSALFFIATAEFALTIFWASLFALRNTFINTLFNTVNSEDNIWSPAAWFVLRNTFLFEGGWVNASFVSLFSATESILSNANFLVSKRVVVIKAFLVWITTECASSWTIFRTVLEWCSTWKRITSISGRIVSVELVINVIITAVSVFNAFATAVDWIIQISSAVNTLLGGVNWNTLSQLGAPFFNSWLAATFR